MAISQEGWTDLKFFRDVSSPNQCGSVEEIWAENSDLYGPPSVESLVYLLLK